MRDKRIKQLFNFIAPVFYLLDIFSIATLHREEAFLYIINRISLKNLKVLDKGCGRGTWSFLFKKEGAIVEAIDFTPKMIELAKRRYDNISFLTINAN